MTPRRLLHFALLTSLFLPAVTLAAQPTSKPHNVILFVADGLRASIVNPDTAPNMAALRDSGVNFANSHALYPTLTTVNAAALATGHYPGDTGNWANVLCPGFNAATAQNGPCVFLESDAVLGELDQHFGGDYLHQQTIMAGARAAGYGTAVVGKKGPALIQDHTARDGMSTIIIDDSTGKSGADSGVPLPQPITDALAAAGLQPPAPDIALPNVKQQDYFAEAFTKVVLPALKSRGKPFYAVFWSRDPDATQHAQSDSKGMLTPGINGRFSLAAIANADADLSKIQESVKALGLEKDTDIIVVADHGFSTIYKESGTSISDKAAYSDVPRGNLPPGFLAIDLARGMSLSLFDPDDNKEELGDGKHPKRGNGLIGDDPEKPDLLVAANGGSDLIYQLQPNPERLKSAIDVLLEEDYVSGIFVRDDLGPVAGALPFSAIGLKGSAATPAPAIVVNFKSFSTGCDSPLRCAASIADTSFGQGQGMHGTFSRADTDNFQAAIGPDFKQKFTDAAPSSNADIAVTIAELPGIKPKTTGKLMGRVLTEAFPGGATPAVKKQTLRSKPAGNGLATIVEAQSVGETRYFDAGGFPGRSVGIAAEPARPK